MELKPGYLHVELDVELNADPIRGRIVQDGGAQSRDFNGWIELAAAIEAARNAGSPPAPGATDLAP